MALPLKGYATFQKKGLPRACPLTHGPLGAVQDPDCRRIRVQWQEKLVQGDSEHILLVGGVVVVVILMPPGGLVSFLEAGAVQWCGCSNLLALLLRKMSQKC